jgi:hypothetical protein
MRRLYLILAIAGFVLPYAFLIQFMLEPGASAGMMFRQLFANNTTRLFAADLGVSAMVFLVWSYREGRRLGMRWWAYWLATAGVGLCFGWPLFLYVRESRLESQAD